MIGGFNLGEDISEMIKYQQRHTELAFSGQTYVLSANQRLSHSTSEAKLS